MHHKFRFTASRFNATESEALVARLRDGLIEAASEAEISDPIRQGSGWGFWLDIGGDRYWAYAGAAEGQENKPTDLEWLAGIEGHEPAFVRLHETRARRQERFDGLVAALRTLIAADSGVELLAEEDD